VRVLVTAVAVFAGLLAGALLRPDPNRFARPKVRWPLVLLIGVVLLAIGTRTEGDPGLRLDLAGYAVLVVGVARNAHIVGMGVLLVGISCNVLVIGMNSGMPVHGPALARVARDGGPTVSPDGHRHLETVDDSLAVLDDRIPLPAGNQVLSFGDLIIAVGLADTVANLTRRRRRELVAPDAAMTHTAVTHTAVTDEVVDLREPAAPATRRPRHLAGSP